MTEPREIIKIKVNESEFDEWMIDNRSFVFQETLTCIEEMLYNKVDSLPIMKIEISTTFGKTILDLKMVREDIDETLMKSLEWAIEFEEFEVAHRIRLIQEYISEQKFKKEYERLLKTNEIDKPKRNSKKGTKE
jgi:hypothetical protein